jgi:hypothetical protein
MLLLLRTYLFLQVSELDEDKTKTLAQVVKA